MKKIMMILLLCGMASSAFAKDHEGTERGGNPVAQELVRQIETRRESLSLLGDEAPDTRDFIRRLRAEIGRMEMELRNVLAGRE